MIAKDRVFLEIVRATKDRQCLFEEREQAIKTAEQARAALYLIK